MQIIGYSDLPSRLPTQSSTLYANNISKFLLSAGEKGHFNIDHNDEVVRGSLVLEKGNLMWPPPTPAAPPVPSIAKKPAMVTAPKASPFNDALVETSITGGKLFFIRCHFSARCKMAFSFI